MNSCLRLILWFAASLFVQSSVAQAPARVPVLPPDPTTTAAFKDIDSIEARVQGCVTCHGNAGQGTADGYYPRIAGKPASYLYNQLAAFRDGTRKYPSMNYLVAYLPDSYLKEIAAHFSALAPPFEAQAPIPAPPAVLARGEALASAGDAATSVPACSACHGAKLGGKEPAIPGLLGLRPDYVVAQLTRWRVGERHAIAPDCMARVAGRLSDADINALAAWLSRQVPTPDAVPEPANLERMPLACGSQAGTK